MKGLNGAISDTAAGFNGMNTKDTMAGIKYAVGQSHKIGEAIIEKDVKTVIAPKVDEIVTAQDIKDEYYR